MSIHFKVNNIDQTAIGTFFALGIKIKKKEKKNWLKSLWVPRHTLMILINNRVSGGYDRFLCEIFIVHTPAVRAFTLVS